MLARTLYRSLMRWTRTPLARETRFIIPLVAPALEAQLPSQRPRNAEGVRAAIRRAFRAPDDGAAGAPALGARLDLGFDALRALHEVVEPQLHTLRRRHEASAARDGVRFRIGQVVAHKRYGYRGVIYGWDPRPAVDVSRWDGVVGLPRRGE